MGGRGADSGISDKGKPYGSEFHSLLKVGNIKFVKYNDSEMSKVPLETMTKGRVYVTVNSQNKLKSISYYKDGKKVKTIDLDHVHNEKKPHTHEGYYHSEHGTRGLLAKEKLLVDFVNKVWYNKHSKT